jgi:hypothetical protein
MVLVPVICAPTSNVSTLRVMSPLPVIVDCSRTPQCGAHQHHVDTAFPKDSLTEDACVKHPLGCEMPAMGWKLQLALHCLIVAYAKETATTMFEAQN